MPFAGLSTARFDYHGASRRGRDAHERAQLNGPAIGVDRHYARAGESILRSGDGLIAANVGSA